MEETKLLDEMIKLKVQLHKYDKAIAIIEYWRNRVGLKTREGVEWDTLEKVLRIFEEVSVEVRGKEWKQSM